MINPAEWTQEYINKCLVNYITLSDFQAAIIFVYSKSVTLNWLWHYLTHKDKEKMFC